MMLTCLTCRLVFTGKDANSVQAADTDFLAVAAALHKDHYKTDWHRYNMNRKAVGLPPVSGESFQEMVLAERSKLIDKTKGNVHHHCHECGKSFSSTNTYENHLQSKRHKEMKSKAAVVSEGDVSKIAVLSKEENVVEMEKVVELEKFVEIEKDAVDLDEDIADDKADDEWEDVDDEGDETLGPEDCLFCPTVSRSLNQNIKHMAVAHSFFIPDSEYLIDLEGLIAHLGERVAQLGMCLWCYKKSRVFVDVRSTQQHMTDKGHCRLLHEGESKLQYAEFYDYSSRDAVSGESVVAGVDEDDIMDEGEETDVPASSEENPFQLVLPSGATVGHRALMVYYKQTLKPGRRLVICNNTSSVSKVMAQYKTLGVLGTTGAAAKKTVKDMSYVNRVQNRRAMHLAVKANKLQHHFRDDNFGCH